MRSESFDTADLKVEGAVAELAKAREPLQKRLASDHGIMRSGVDQRV